jgi:cytochrome c2
VQRIFRSKDDLIGSGSGSSRMILLDDGTLLVGIPENDSYKARAQRLDSHIGKLVRIHRDGSVPADNPFVNTPGALPEIYSYGHRVTLGLFQDPDSGQVLVAESGPAGGDEVNLLKAGANYGWARASWGFDYTGALAAPLQSAPGIEDPLLVWTPAVTPAGLIRYLGDAFPLWYGDYFVGHLTARQVERIRIEGNRVVLQERLLADLGERIRDLKVGPDGLIYILTDHQNARLLRLRPGTPAAEDQNRVARKLEEEVDLEGNIEAPDIGPGDPVRGRQAFLEHCSACHRVGSATAGGSIGPDLAGVFGRNAGSLEGYRFSQAMTDSPQVWNARTLNLFMADPQRYLPGTKMSSPPVPELEMRRNIVGFLQQPLEK